MKGFKLLAIFGSFLMFSSVALGQAAIPAGTILPVTLTSGISAHTRAGQTVKATIMQDVPLPRGARIRSGAKVFGTILAVVSAKSGSGPQLALQFNKILLRDGKAVPVTTALRALASYVEVDAAQTPDDGADRGSPYDDRTIVLIGGDVDYKGGGPVMEGNALVGEPVANGVLSRVTAKSGSPCEGSAETALGPQALWLFSSDACGVYGMPHISIQHMGAGSGGRIELTGDSGEVVRIAKGAGMLLVVL